MPLIEGMTALADALGATLEKVKLANEALAKLEKQGYGKTPATIHEEGMNQYEAAQEMRALVRKIELQPTGGLTVAVSELRMLLNKPQSKKADRIEKLAQVEAELAAHQTQAAASLARMKILVQRLPTQPHLPTNKAANVVTAFVAILKSNGILNKDGTVNL